MNGAPPPRTSRLLRGLLISTVTLVVLAAALEVVGYAWERHTSAGPLGWALVASRRLVLEPKGLPERVYYLAEPGRQYRWGDIPVAINSRGLRDEEHAADKPAATRRILNLGDSVVFGWNVRQGDTYGAQLQQLLSARGGQRTEVIDAGIPGWTIEHARNFADQEGFAYAPDAVVLDITVVNDVYGSGPHLSSGSPLVDWLRDETHLWPFLTTQARFLAARRYGPEAIPALNPPTAPEAYYPLDEQSPVWEELWRWIADLDAGCRRRGVPLVLLVFPTGFQINDGHPDVPQRVFARRAAAAGIAMVDLLPIYQAACQAHGAESCRGLVNLLSADVWMHPTPLAHRLAAEALLERVG
jgi:hypothetical protein